MIRGLSLTTRLATLFAALTAVLLVLAAPALQLTCREPRPSTVARSRTGAPLLFSKRHFSGRA